MAKQAVNKNTETEAKKAEAKEPTFGERLLAERKQLGLSQAQFAERLGFSSNVPVSHYESDAVLPSAEALTRMGRDMKIDVHELLTGEPSPSLAVEVEAIRTVKHGFRELLNEVRVKTKGLKKLDRLIRACIEAIEAGLNPPKEAQAEDGGESENKSE